MADFQCVLHTDGTKASEGVFVRTLRQLRELIGQHRIDGRDAVMQIAAADAGAADKRIQLRLCQNEGRVGYGVYSFQIHRAGSVRSDAASGMDADDE